MVVAVAMPTLPGGIPCCGPGAAEGRSTRNWTGRMYILRRERGTAKLNMKADEGEHMRVEWTSYNSPIGVLTVVECEAGPLVVEYPNRAVTIKWAVRLRAAVPELHIAQGSCPTTSSWLDAYFAGSPTSLPFPSYLKSWFDLSPAQAAVFRTLR